ncbi:MAG TPA: methyltransferase domain-containing protein [Blastocatellia bacterium]|nr:methyltransferase domain-containing protein [Blastocatellia bacterium]
MNTHQQITVDQFTRQALPFSQSQGHTNEESLRLLIEMARLSGEDTALDVACGTGMVACAFATIANHVTGIDITPAMLDQARLLAKRCGLTNLFWRQGDIETLPFPENEFSVVVSRYAFHHFLNPDVVLAEMTRVCRPGGRILIADGCPPPEKQEAYNHFEKLFDPSHHRALTLDEFLGLIRDAGLQTERLAQYKMEMEMERQLAASFPDPGDDEKIRRLLQEDIGVDRIGVGAHWRGDEIHYAYPVTVIVAEKAA